MHRRYSYANRSAMTADVRRMLEVRPRGHVGRGLSNTEGRVMEIMLRENGVRGAFLVMAGFLRMIAYILHDAATLLELVEYDLPNDPTPISDVPADDVLVEVDEGEEESLREDLDDEEIVCEDAGVMETETAEDETGGEHASLEGGDEIRELQEDDMESENEGFALMTEQRPLSREVKNAADSAAAAVKWLVLRRGGLLRGLLAQVRRACRSKLPVLALVGNDLLKWPQKRGGLPESSTCKMNQPMKRMWKTIRAIARRAGKKAQQDKGAGDWEEGVSLMQTHLKDKFVGQIDADLAYTGEGWWLRMLQRDLESLKSRKVLIGAHVAQLLDKMEAFAAATMPNACGPAADRLAMLVAVLQTYAAEAADEALDIADVWAETWARRLQCFLLPRGMASVNEEAVLIDDSQLEEAELAEDCSAQEVVALQREIMVARQARARHEQSQRRAAKEREWDDWAMGVALSQPCCTRMRARSFQIVEEVRDVGTQTGGVEEPSSSSSKGMLQKKKEPFHKRTKHDTLKGGKQPSGVAKDEQVRGGPSQAGHGCGGGEKAVGSGEDGLVRTGPGEEGESEQHVHEGSSESSGANGLPRPAGARYFHEGIAGLQVQDGSLQPLQVAGPGLVGDCGLAGQVCTHYFN